MVILFPTVSGGDDECQPGTEEKCGGAQSVEELMQLKPSEVLQIRREKCADDVPFEHKEDNGSPVEVDEPVPDLLFRKRVRHVMEFRRRERS
jgi:hypothetical protein